jgi:hypothetical protein
MSALFLIRLRQNASAVRAPWHPESIASSTNAAKLCIPPSSIQPKILKQRIFYSHFANSTPAQNALPRPTSVPNPKFAELCGGLYCELRVRLALVYDQTSGGLLNNHTVRRV